MQTVDFNALFAQGIFFVVCQLIAFAAGAWFLWRHNITRASTDIITQLTADNKAYQSLLESLKSTDAVHQVQLHSMMREIGELKGQLHSCELHSKTTTTTEGNTVISETEEVKTNGEIHTL